MRNIILPLLLLFSAASCNTWSEETKQTWQQACTDNANTWAASKEDAKTYCDCVMEKMMARYPDVNEALEHTGELATDTSFYQCRQQVKLK